MTNIAKVQKMTGGRKRTKEGGVGYQPTFKEAIAEFFSLGLLNGNFYQSQEEVLREAKGMFERALAEIPEFATKSAIYGNNVNSLKLVPTVWLVYLSTLEDKRLFEVAFPRIIRNPKMLHDFIEICRKGGIRDGLGRSVKKTINKWLVSTLNGYQVSRNKGKLSEVIKVTRPKATEHSLDFQSYMTYIAKGELTFPRAVELKQVLSNLENGLVDEETVNLIEKNRFQLEELKHSTANLSVENKKILYSTLYKGLNYTALILNLVALERVFATQTEKTQKYRTQNGRFTPYTQTLVLETDIPEEIIQMVVAKIKDVASYRKSNMLPFALITAERMVVTPEFQLAIGDLLKTVSSELFTIDNSIDLMLGVDTSGSMDRELTDSLTVVEVASLFGAMVKKAHTKTKVFAVATTMKEVSVRKQDDLFNMARQIEATKVGYGTNFEKIMANYTGQKYVMLFTDSESTDDLEKKWLSAIKPKGAKLIVWQMQPSYTRVSKDPSVVYLCGYSDRLLGLAKNIIEGKAGQIETIEQIKL